MTPPLTLAEFPVTGPTGERDNIERLCTAMNALLPPGMIASLDVGHDPECPCESGSRPMSACTCETVSVTLRAGP